MMDDRRTGWRNTPPILLVAFALQLAFSLVHLGVRMAESADRSFEDVHRWDLASNGIWALFAVMVCVGLFDLAARRTGGAAIGARVAGLAFVSLYALGVALNALFVFELMPHGEWIWRVEQYVYWTVNTAAAIGLAVAGAPRARALMGVGLALCLASRLPPVLGEAIFGGMDLGRQGAELVRYAFGLVHTIGLLLLVVAATDGVAAPRRELAARGFGLAASALWLRLIAALVGVLLTVVAVSSRGDGGVGAIKLAMFASLVVNLVSFAMFGLGALHAARSAIDGVSRGGAAIAAAASLWCAGVMLEQLPQYYKILYGGDAFGGSSSRDHLQALSIALPIVGTLAGAALAAVIAGLARARNDAILTTSAGSAGVGYTLLMLASVGITSFLLEKADSAGGAIGMMLVAAGCGLAAQVMLAKVCRTASTTIDHDPGLPQATAKVSGPT